MYEETTYPECRTAHDTLGDHGNMIRARKIDIEEEPDEVAVVEMSDTVVYPRTVVIYK